MYIKKVWPRPRVYSLYPQKSRRPKWLGIAIVPIVLAGAWFVVPSRMPANVAAASDEASAQSVAVTEPETTDAAVLAETPVSTKQPLADARYTQLQQSVEKWTNTQPKSQQWSVVVQDINSDTNRVAVNERSTYYMASLYKLFLTLPLSQKYPLQTWASTSVNTDSGKQNLDTCVKLMISKSDNSCGEGVGQLVGWVATTKAARAKGMTATSLSSTDLRSSARDVSTYMLGLQQHKWFDEPTRQALLTDLSQQTFRSGIPAGCAGCSVWNKTGDLNGAKHDAAIVHVGTSDFVLVVMSNGGSNAQIADVTRLVASSLR